MRSLLLVAGMLFSTMALVGSANAQVRTGIGHPTYGSMHGYTVHEHARDHVRLLYHYARTRAYVPKNVVVRHTKAVRANIRSAKQVNEEFVKATADDENSEKILASIAGHQRQAVKHLKAIENAAQD